MANIEKCLSEKDRFKVYKKALKLCESWVYGTYELDNEPCLCFLLPCIQFKLDSYNDVYIEAWRFEETPEYYPEIESFVEFIYENNFDESRRNSERINFLKTLLNKP